MSQQHGNNTYPQPNNQPYNNQPYNQPYNAGHSDNNQYNRMANQPEPITSSSMGITVPFEKAEINHPHMANANPTRNGYDLTNNPNVMSDPSQGPGGHRFVNPDNSGMGPAYNNNGPYGNAGTGQNMPYNSGHPDQCNNSNMPNNIPYDNSNLPGNNGQYNSNMPVHNGHYNSNMPGHNGHYNSNMPGNNGQYNNGQYGNGPYNGTGAGSDHPYNPNNSVMGADEGTILKERIKGGVEKLAGKITGNPAKVAQGQQRMAAADAASYNNSNGGGLMSGSRRDATDNRIL